MSISASCFSLQDHQYMQKAIELAKKGHYTTSPNPRVGCVIVKDGKIIGEGFHQKAGEGHAEVHALAEAGTEAIGATVYVTLEPCSHFGRTPPCAEALINANVAKVIAAMVDPNPKVSGNGLAKLQAAGIETAFGLLNADAKALNVGFITLMETQKPYVRCKLAASLDGKTAMANGESQWITSPEARQDVQRLRAQSCAIISGSDSIIADNARMTVRHEELGSLANDYPIESLRQPTRVILDRKNRLTAEVMSQLALFKESSPIIIFRAKKEVGNDIPKLPEFAEVIEIPTVAGKLDLHQVINQLAVKGFNDVLIESGMNLAGGFIDADLVDELILYQAPKLMGANSLSLVSLPKVTQLGQAKNVQFTDIRMIGNDLRITSNFNR